MASTVGSWPFIIFQSGLLGAWIALSIFGVIRTCDPNPFTVLGLYLSCQGAFIGPMVMMSQNRRSALDRETMQKDFEFSEESAKLLAQVVAALQSLERDRKTQLELLMKILCELDEEEPRDVP